MSSRYLVIKNNVVVNVIVWSGATYSPGPEVVLLSCDKHPGIDIGWTRNLDDTWTPPEEPGQEESS